MHTNAKRGSTEECFRDLLSQSFKRDPIPMMATFTHTHPDTFKRKWLRQFTALGDGLLRLRYLLELMGYEVAELEALDPLVRDLGRLYAYNIADLADLATELGYQNDESNGQVRKILMGQRGMSPERIAIAQKLVDSFHEIVETKRRELSVLQELVIVETPNPMAPGRAVAPRPKGSAPSANEAVITAFAHGVQALVPLARLLMSDQFSPDERRRMRELANGTGVFELSNLLNGLCGEKARDRAQSQGV